MSKPIEEERKIHKLKTWQPYFSLILSGKKNFEVRKNDRDFKVGDRLDLFEYDPEKKIESGNHCHRYISYILDGGEFGIEKGYCVLGLEIDEPTPPQDSKGAEEIENYHSRLKEVLKETGKLDETDLEYCKLLTKAELATPPQDSKGAEEYLPNWCECAPGAKSKGAEEYNKITGFNTPDELAAYEKGQRHYENVIIKFIENWNGETNSVLGKLLSKKLTTRKENNKAVPSDEEIEGMASKLDNTEMEKTAWECGAKWVRDNLQSLKESKGSEEE